MAGYDSPPDIFTELRTIRSRLAEIERQTSALNEGWVQPVWHRVGAPGEPAFQPGFTTYSPAAYPLSYYLDPWGFCHLRGVTISNLPTVSHIFTLPVGFRPLSDLSLPNASTAFNWVDVEDGGAVLVNPNVPSSTLVKLDGIAFSTKLGVSVRQHVLIQD
jgi:hypothetical protein